MLDKMGRKGLLVLVGFVVAGAVGGLAVSALLLQSRLTDLEAQMRKMPKQIDSKLVPKAEESALARQDLIKLAGGATFVDADVRERREMLRSWCKKNMKGLWGDLNPDQRELLLFRLELQLDDLLAEREFGVKEV